MSMGWTPPIPTVKVRNGLDVVNGFIELGGALVRDTNITGINQSFSVNIDDGNQAASFNISSGTASLGANDSSGFTPDSAALNVSVSAANISASGEDGSENSQTASIGVQSVGIVALGYRNNVTGNMTSMGINPGDGLGLHVIDTESEVGISYDEIYNGDLNADFGLNVTVGGQFKGFERVVASSTQITLNASVPDYLTYTNPIYSSLMISAWLELYGAGTIVLTVQFVDIQGVAQTVSFPLVSGAGFFALSPILIASQAGSDVQVNAVNTGGVTYDIAVTIMASQNQ